MLSAVVGLWTGGAAVRALALGRGADWLDLAVGVLGTLYVAAAAALLADRFRGRRTPAGV